MTLLSQRWIGVQQHTNLVRAEQQCWQHVAWTGVLDFGGHLSCKRYTETERKSPHARVEHACRTNTWSGGQFQTIHDNPQLSVAALYTTSCTSVRDQEATQPALFVSGAKSEDGECWKDSIFHSDKAGCYDGPPNHCRLLRSPERLRVTAVFLADCLLLASDKYTSKTLQALQELGSAKWSADLLLAAKTTKGPQHQVNILFSPAGSHLTWNCVARR